MNDRTPTSTYAAPLLDRHETARLIALANKGDIEAQNRVVLSNMGLVYDIVNKRFRRHLEREGTHLTFDDLIMYGADALFYAIRNYDPAKGMFTTHAYFWIRARIRRAIDETEDCIRWPSHYHTSMDRLEREREHAVKTRELDGEQQKAWTREYIKSNNLPCQNTIAAVDASLDTPLENETSTLLDVLACSDNSIEDDVVNSVQQKMLLGLLDDLPSNLKQVVELHLGLNGCRPHSSREISELLNFKDHHQAKHTYYKAIGLLKSRIERDFSPEEIQDMSEIR